MSNPEPKGRGRPTKYQPAFSEQTEKLCRLGATDAEIADFFGVDESTVNTWKKRHPEFSKSLKDGKLQADMEVAEKLYRRALGYSHESVKIFVHEGNPVIVPYTERYPPDTAAMIFWLKNRQPKKWRDKVEVEAEIDLRVIPWNELRALTPEAIERAEQRHREIIEGRAERLGLKINYTADNRDD
jgi:hypothetical protein